MALTAAVRDVLRPVSGAPLSPRIGDLMLADLSTAPTWVAFSIGGGGAAGKECYPINEGAVADGGRLVFRSGLSVAIGAWRREPLPSQGLELGRRLPGSSWQRRGARPGPGRSRTSPSCATDDGRSQRAHGLLTQFLIGRLPAKTAVRPVEVVEASDS